jgi:hypothetical protein
MFRQIDKLHMQRVKSGLDLLDYDSVKANAADIQSFACVDNPTMPPKAAGGFWPAEWKAVFNRWVDGGFLRLSVGTGQNIVLAKAAGNTFQLSCSAAIPNTPDATAWLDIVDPGPATATYRLVVFPGETVPPPAATKNVNLRERVDNAAAANGVTLIDSAGSHNVTVAVT